MSEAEVVAGMKAGEPMPVVGESQCIARGHPFIPDSSLPQWFFSDPAACARLLATFIEWDRTPFARGSRAKGAGGGIDCEAFAEEIMIGAGVIDKPFDFQRGDSDFKGHAHNDKFLNYLRGKYVAPGSSEIDPRSLRLAEILAELDNIEELVPKAEWPDRLVVHTGLMPGDLLIIRPRTGIWHLPIMLNDRMFVHCAYPGGVTEGDITQEDFRSRIVAAFRARALHS